MSPDDPIPSSTGISGSQIPPTTARAGKARAGASRSGYLIPTAPPPVLISISPSSVTVGDPNFTLHAYGNTFDAGAVIQWNGVTLTTTVVTAGTHLSAPVVTSAYPAGTYAVTVRNGTGIPSPSLPFTVALPPPPVLDAIAPSSVVVGSANFMLTATGSAFDAGAVILWNGVALTTSRVSETQLTATIDMAGAVVGPVPVTVRNGSGLTSAALTFTIAPPPPPVLATLSPSSAALSDPPFPLHTFGSNFKPGAVIQWAGVALTTSRVSATELIAAVDPRAYAAGNYAITVRNTDGGVSGPQTFAILAAPPSLLPAISIGGELTGARAARRVLVTSLSISDQLNEVPNTCTFTVQGARPPDGAEIVIAYDTIGNPDRLFAGNILRVTDVTANPNDPRTVLYQVEGIDYTWQLQARLVIGRYANLSATAIAADLIAQWAPAGFTGQIEAGLPVLDEISFTNTPLMDAFAQLAKRIGGYAQGDYFKRIALWITPTGTPPTALTPDHPSLASLSVSRDLSQIVTRALMEGGGVNALGPVDPGETRLPLEDTAWYAPGGGLVVSGPQRIRYTGVVAPGGGAMASAVGGTTGNTAPSAAPSITTSPGAGLPLGTYKYAYTWITATGECLPSPLKAFNGGAAGGPVTSPTSLTKSGTGLGTGRYLYAYTWTTANGETIPSPVSAAADTSSTVVNPPAGGPALSLAAMVGLPNGTYRYAVTFVTATGETTPGPTTSATTTSSSSTATIPNPTTAPTLALLAGDGLPDGTYTYGYSFVNTAGETLANKTSAITTTSTASYVSPPVRPSVASAVADPAGFVSDNVAYVLTFVTAQGETTESLLSTPSYTTGGAKNAFTVTIATGPTGVTARKLYRTKGGVFGGPRYLVATISNNNQTSYVDKIPDTSLGGGPPSSNGTATYTYNRQVKLSTIPVGPTGTTARKVYRSKIGAGSGALKYLLTINDNTTTTVATPDTTPDTSLGSDDPTTNTTGITTTTYSQGVNVAGIPIGPADATGRKIYRTVKGGTTLALLATLNNNVATSLASPDTTPDASLGPAPPATNTTTINAKQITVSGIAAGPSGTTGRKLYRTYANGTALYLLTTLANNTTTTYTDATPDASLGAAAPSSGTAVLALAVVGGIATGTAGLVTSRKVYRTKLNGSALFLLTTIANNSATAIAADSTPDASLGAAAPATDTSGLVSGSGGQVNAGATSIPVASVDAFKPEGWAEVGTQLIRYHGVSSSALTGIPPSGPGSLGVSIQFDAPITVAPQLTGIPASGAGAIVLPILLGDPVNLLVILDDLNAQTALAALIGGTGVVEGFEQDNRISYDEAVARALARLDQKGTVLETLRYRCRDPRSRSGATIDVALPPPFEITGTFEIQSVTIGEFLGTEQLPAYDVVASSERLTFEDFLRRRRGGSSNEI
jgi:hypothetical protein